MQARTDSELIPPRLGLFDAVSIIVGIIIGVGIFEFSTQVFRQVPDPAIALGAWALGGVLALIGALCFAELASAYPRSGGEYVYLTRAFGPWLGYLFAWAQLGVIRTGNIALLGYFFATYADRLWDIEMGSWGIANLAALSIVVLTLINVLGVTLGKGTQNVLTILKVLGLGAIVVAGLLLAQPRETDLLAGEAPAGWFAEVMILVLWTYSGWHEAAYIAAEVKDGRRNIPLALILGSALVTVIYLLVNLALLTGLGFQDARAETAVGDLLASAFGEGGRSFFYLLVIVSVLGGLNGMIFTTSRIYSELGNDHRLFAPLSKWSRRWGTPVRSLLVQGGISVALTLAVGIWFKGQTGIETMLYFTAAVFWIFFFLTGVSVFILRRKDPDLPRPFRVPGYPIVPIIFCLWCAYMVYGAITYKWKESLIGLAILAAGIPFFFIPRKLGRLRARSSGRPLARDDTEMIMPTPARWHVR